MEKTNIRYVTPEDIGEPIDFSSIDVSFISLTKVLEPIRNYLKEDGEIVALIKPQFEAGREKVGKKGVVRDRAVHREVIQKVADLCAAYRIWRNGAGLFTDPRTGRKYRISDSPEKGSREHGKRHGKGCDFGNSG